MGLGGLTRDSIVGLNNLVNNDDDVDYLPQRRPSSSRNSDVSFRGSASFEHPDPSGQWAVPTQTKQTDDFFFIAGDFAEESGFPSSSVPTSISLNDEHTNAEVEDASASLSPRSSAAVAAATSYNKVSATNSRSLDSYNTSPQASTYQGFQYEGYTDYYTEDYSSYMHDDFATGGASGKDGGIFCCLFAPWIQQSKVQLEDDEAASSGHLGPDGSAASKSDEEGEGDEDTTDPRPPNTAQQDASSELDGTASPLENKIGEGESPEQKAVVFSMSDGLGPEKELSPHMMSSHRSDADDTTASSTASSTSCTDDQKFAAREEAAGPEVKLKGILKVRCRPAVSSKNQESPGISSNASTAGSPTKRHLFPSYSPRHTQLNSSDSKKDLTFNPMARVLTIPSRMDIPYTQKTQVWWQRCDYDEFKKTGRIISKAMECGGSDIWLASSNAWGQKQANQRKVPRKMSSDAEYDKALSRYVGRQESEESDDDARIDYGNKWWCKFGHSRRGLEHVVSASEGKARQKSVLLAIKQVVDEQRRQRAARIKDPNKLRNVSMQYTSWARDLAHAAGIADAEAVSSDFDQSAKTRAHYYAKKMNISQESSIDLNRVGSGVVRAVTSSILDANTHSKKKAASTDPVPVRSSESSLGKLAKGFMPGPSPATIGQTQIRA